MAKPITLTDALITKYVKEFKDALSKGKFADGKVIFSKDVEYEDSEKTKATILFDPLAYTKMIMLLYSFNSEVAWHGVVERIDKGFYIKDILVYPQEVSGATVNTDQEEYQKWMMELDDEQANHLHMQGHSHVNMSTTPSSVDLTHQGSILKMVQKDQFYIFMIYNKRLEHNIKIYDVKENVLYEDKDINVGLFCEGGDLEAFMEGANKLVQAKTYAPKITKETSLANRTVAKASKPTKKKSPKKKDDESETEFDEDEQIGMYSPSYHAYGYGYGGEFDYDDYIFGKGGYR